MNNKPLDSWELGECVDKLRNGLCTDSMLTLKAITKDTGVEADAKISLGDLLTHIDHLILRHALA